MQVRKIIASVLTGTILSGAVPYYNNFNADASGYPLLELRPNGQKIYEAEAGEIVELQYNVSGTQGWCSSGIHFTYDSRLELEFRPDGRILFEKGDAGLDIRGYEVRPVNPDFFPYKIDGLDENENCIFIATSSNGDYGYDGTIATFYFKVPEDAKAGTRYDFEFIYFENDMFTDRSRNQDMQDYAFANWNGGTVIIPEVTTMTSETTTTTTSITITTTTTTSSTTSTTESTTLSSSTTITTTTSSYTTSETTTSTTVNNDIKKGDANNDSLLDVADVVAVASYVGNPDANKLDEQCIKNADVHNTGDGLTANDALTIQQYLAKILEQL
ncbi:MAG: hypothetical protein K2G63_05750 [Oscillospiraceae bacterium]|nr:hypothetical protein [Oscillospiraceae bacterium]